MSRIDRALGILLQLASGRSVSTAELARDFDVSGRTIHRDLDSLSALGVPIYANRGRGGGFQLLDHYFLPPVRLSSGEAISVLLGMALLESLPSRPFSADGATAATKILSALPTDLRAALADASSLIGFEEPPVDTFHYELGEAAGGAPPEAAADVGATTAAFLLAALATRGMILRYRSPYRVHEQDIPLEPLGILWDRRRWYLVGRRRGKGSRPHMLRADRVSDLRVDDSTPAFDRHGFDVRSLLHRAWLTEAMHDWIGESPVVLHLTTTQAQRLQRDWYYRHAAYECLPDGGVQMTYGGDNCDATLELLRWLGPGATLVQPSAWRARHIELLQSMLDDAQI